MAKLKPGPPSKFTQELADQICDLMVEGHDLVESCDILNTQSKQNLLIFRIRILFSLIKICLWQM